MHDGLTLIFITEKAQRVYEQNVQTLEHGMDSQNDAFEETLHREPGTCQWIFKEEDYREWHTSEKNSMLWVSANGGMLEFAHR